MTTILKERIILGIQITVTALVLLIVVKTIGAIYQHYTTKTGEATVAMIVENTLLVPKNNSFLSSTPEQYLVVLNSPSEHRVVVDNLSLWSLCKAGNQVDVPYVIQTPFLGKAHKVYKWEQAKIIN